MTAGSQSDGRQSSSVKLRALYERFTHEAATCTSQLSAWSHAREQWRGQWGRRATLSSALLFPRLIPNVGSGGQQWTHPVADEAPELDRWKAQWHAATPAAQTELSEIFVRAIALVDGDRASLRDACALLARSTGSQGLPLAALTPALSALDPVRFVVVCEAWLRMLGEYNGGELSGNVGAYPELNAIALEWLATAEGGSPLPALADSPSADRFGVFSNWITRTVGGATSGARFDVTKRKYKDWPPMW